MELDKKIDKLKDNLLAADIKLELELHADQNFGENGVLTPKIVLMCSR